MTSKNKRAASGESSIYKDEKGRWHGYVSMGLKANGKRDRRHRTGRTRAEVVKKVRELEEQRDADAVVATGRWTVGKWLDHWMETMCVLRLRPKTYQGYESKIRVHIKPAIGHIDLKRLQPEDLESLYAKMAADGLSSGTAALVHKIMRRALKVAVSRGRVGRNVALYVDTPPVQRSPEVVPIAVGDAQKILVKAKERRNAARWSVALALGLRQGEALGALWSQVDMENGVWHVIQQSQRTAYRHGCKSEPCGKEKPQDCPARTGGILFADPKSQKGKRKIGIPPQLLDELRAHRQAQLAERLAAGSEWHDNDLVFAQANGKPYDGKQDWLLWRNLLRAADVPHARVHDARHTAASILLAQRVPTRIVMEILGHSSTAVTENIYQHVMPEVIAEATSGVADVLYAPQATTVAPLRSRKRSS